MSAWLFNIFLRLIDRGQRKNTNAFIDEINYNDPNYVSVYRALSTRRTARPDPVQPKVYLPDRSEVTEIEGEDQVVRILNPTNDGLVCSQIEGYLSPTLLTGTNFNGLPSGIRPSVSRSTTNLAPNRSSPDAVAVTRVDASTQTTGEWLPASYTPGIGAPAVVVTPNTIKFPNIECMSPTSLAYEGYPTPQSTVSFNPQIHVFFHNVSATNSVGNPSALVTGLSPSATLQSTSATIAEDGHHLLPTPPRSAHEDNVCLRDPFAETRFENNLWNSPTPLSPEATRVSVIGPPSSDGSVAFTFPDSTEVGPSFQKPSGSRTEWFGATSLGGSLYPPEPSLGSGFHSNSSLDGLPTTSSLIISKKILPDELRATEIESAPPNINETSFPKSHSNLPATAQNSRPTGNLNDLPLPSFLQTHRSGMNFRNGALQQSGTYPQSTRPPAWPPVDPTARQSLCSTNQNRLHHPRTQVTPRCATALRDSPSPAPAVEESRSSSGTIAGGTAVTGESFDRKPKASELETESGQKSGEKSITVVESGTLDSSVRGEIGPKVILPNVDQNLNKTRTEGSQRNKGQKPSTTTTTTSPLALSSGRFSSNRTGLGSFLPVTKNEWKNGDTRIALGKGGDTTEQGERAGKQQNAKSEYPVAAIGAASTPLLGTDHTSGKSALTSDLAPSHGSGSLIRSNPGGARDSKTQESTLFKNGTGTGEIRSDSVAASQAALSNSNYPSAPAETRSVAVETFNVNESTNLPREDTSRSARTQSFSEGASDADAGAGGKPGELRVSELETVLDGTQSNSIPAIILQKEGTTGSETVEDESRNTTPENDQEKVNAPDPLDIDLPSSNSPSAFSSLLSSPSSKTLSRNLSEELPLTGGKESTFSSTSNDSGAPFRNGDPARDTDGTRDEIKPLESRSFFWSEGSEAKYQGLDLTRPTLKDDVINNQCCVEKEERQDAAEDQRDTKGPQASGTTPPTTDDNVSSPLAKSTKTDEQEPLALANPCPDDLLNPHMTGISLEKQAKPWECFPDKEDTQDCLRRAIELYDFNVSVGQQLVALRKNGKEDSTRVARSRTLVDLKQTAFSQTRRLLQEFSEGYDPYTALGSGEKKPTEELMVSRTVDISSQMSSRAADIAICEGIVVFVLGLSKQIVLPREQEDLSEVYLLIKTCAQKEKIKGEETLERLTKIYEGTRFSVAKQTRTTVRINFK